MNQKLSWQDFQVGELPRQSLLVETAKEIGKRIEVFTELTHPHFLRDVAVERKEGHYYLGREAKEGLISLAEFLKEDTIPPEDFLEGLIVALDVLAFMHGEGVSLEGVTLESVFVAPSGEIYLTDYAPSNRLAAFRPQKEREEYFPPEYYQGVEANFATDVWSLGITAYRALTGVFPFADEEAKLISEKILEREPLDPRYYNPQISPGLAKFLLMLLEKNPEKRPTASEALAEARELQKGEGGRATEAEAQQYSSGEQEIAKFERRWQRKRFCKNNWGWFAGGLALVLIIVSLFRGGQTKPTVTEQTTPRKVVELYYKALDDLDVLVMEETIDKKVGKQNLDMVSRLHVIEKVNMGMKMQSLEQEKGPKPDLVQVRDLAIEGEEAQGVARYTARYKLTLPGEGGSKTTPKEDELVLKRVEGKWQIVEYESKDL